MNVSQKAKSPVDDAKIVRFYGFFGWRLEKLKDDAAKTCKKGVNMRVSEGWLG